MTGSSARGLVAAVALWTAGCTDEKAPGAAASTAGDSVAAARTADSAARAAAADSVQSLRKAAALKTADSAKRARSRARRDSAFGPRYEVDSTGKVVPVRKKP